MSMQILETEAFAQNLLVARIAVDRNITLASALKRIRNKTLVPTEPWHTLAGKCRALNVDQFYDHLASLMHPSEEDGPDESVRMSTLPDNEELKPYDQSDLLPHFLFAASLAEHGRTSILTAWQYVGPYLNEEIGTFWHWLAQEVRALPCSA
jgi:hypothetical protein